MLRFRAPSSPAFLRAQRCAPETINLWKPPAMPYPATLCILIASLLHGVAICSLPATGTVYGAVCEGGAMCEAGSESSEHLASRNARQHPFHVSAAEIEFNAEEQHLEISIGMWAGDLEQALTAAYGRPVRFENPPDDSKHSVSDKAGDLQLQSDLQEYLAETFCILDSNQQRLENHWLGYELEDGQCWAYLVVRCDAETLARCKIQNEILLDFSEQQINVMSFRVKGEKFTRTATLENSVLPVGLGRRSLRKADRTPR